MGLLSFLVLFILSYHACATTPIVFNVDANPIAGQQFGLRLFPADRLDHERFNAVEPVFRNPVSRP